MQFISSLPTTLESGEVEGHVTVDGRRRRTGLRTASLLYGDRRVRTRTPHGDQRLRTIRRSSTAEAAMILGCVRPSHHSLTITSASQRTTSRSFVHSVTHNSSRLLSPHRCQSKQLVKHLVSSAAQLSQATYSAGLTHKRTKRKKIGHQAARGHQAKLVEN